MTCINPSKDTALDGLYRGHTSMSVANPTVPAMEIHQWHQRNFADYPSELKAIISLVL